MVGLHWGMPGKQQDVMDVLNELEHEAEIEQAFTKAFGEDPSEKLVINEFAVQVDTVKEDRRSCKYCKQPVRVKIYGRLEYHNAPCGRPCLGGGVSPGARFHDDRCIMCIFEGGIEKLRNS